MNIFDLGGGIWRLSETLEGFTVDAYLVVGENRAVLIDALMSTKGMHEQIRKITDLPLDVVLTHAHGDHTGASLDEFHARGCTIYMDMRDATVLNMTGGDFIDEKWLTDLPHGTVFDLGGFKLEVLAVPGHTPGSVVVLERDRQLLFTGDTLGSGTFWMHLPHSLPLASFAADLEKLWAQVSGMDNLIVYPGHYNPNFAGVNLQYVKDTLDITKGLISGEMVGEDGEMDLGPIKLQFKRIGHGTMQDYLYDPGNIMS